MNVFKVLKKILSVGVKDGPANLLKRNFNTCIFL